MYSVGIAYMPSGQPWGCVGVFLFLLMDMHSSQQQITQIQIFLQKFIQGKYHYVYQIQQNSLKFTCLEHFKCQGKFIIKTFALSELILPWSSTCIVWAARWHLFLHRTIICICTRDKSFLLLFSPIFLSSNSFSYLFCSRFC